MIDTFKKYIPLRFRVTTSVYAFWFCVNIIFCLIPIGISAVIIFEFTDSIFANFLAFIYTLLIVSLYMFDSNNEDNWLLRWGGLFFVFLIFFIFIAYPDQLPDPLKQSIHLNLWTISSVVLLSAIIISFFLNKRSLDDRIEMMFNKKKKENAKNIGNRVTDMKEQIREGL